MKTFFLWLAAVAESIAATLILPAYPIFSGILYALALEDLERIADEKEI